MKLRASLYNTIMNCKSIFSANWTHTLAFKASPLLRNNCGPLPKEQKAVIKK